MTAPRDPAVGVALGVAVGVGVAVAAVKVWVGVGVAVLVGVGVGVAVGVVPAFAVKAPSTTRAIMRTAIFIVRSPPKDTW